MHALFRQIQPHAGLLARPILTLIFVSVILAVRYAWIDTSAVSIGWGPRHKGRGGVGPGKLLEPEKGRRNDITPQVFLLILFYNL